MNEETKTEKGGINEQNENNKLHEEKKALDKAKELEMPEEEGKGGDSGELPVFSDMEEAVPKMFEDEETKVSNDEIASRHHAATRIADSEMPELPGAPHIVAPMSH